MTFLNYLIQAILILLPIFIGGIFFILSLKKGHFSFLKKPLDFGYKVSGKRIFGNNKTFRGVILMSLYTAVFILVFGRLLTILKIDLTKIIFDYSPGGSLKGLFYGLAYSLGELPNSFLKRQLNIPSGGTAQSNSKKRVFKIIDNIDSLLACVLVLFFLYDIELKFILGAFILGIILHLATDFLMKKIGLKK